MNIEEIGEFGLIKQLASLTPTMPQGVEGIGDDCAIFPGTDKASSYLLTTDLLVENVHFTRATISPENLGYKSLAVSLSDIAAMGGKPLYLILSLAIPKNTDLNWIHSFIQGLTTFAKEENVLLLGGDTSRSDLITINTTVVGCMETARIKRRSQAKMGDLVCSTGYLGDSGAGLEILEKKIFNPYTEPLIQAHVHPRPHLPEGQWLSEQEGVHAMMDLSDGLKSDIQRLMEQSKCGASIDIDSLPLSPSMRSCTKLFHWNAEEMAICSGEDYCLLVTVDPTNYEQINENYQEMFDRPLFKLGRIVEGSQVSYFKSGQPYELSNKGFTHF